MNIVSKEHLITGRINEKTQEKIRIKLRFLLNKYRRASIFHSDFSDSKLAFHLENQGFKKAYIIYQSAAFKNCIFYSNVFNDLYYNEVEPLDENVFIENKEGKSKNCKLIIATKKLKKGY